MAFALLLLGFGAGIIGGVLGIGGGVIILPVLIFIFKYSPPLAIGTSLFAAIFISISGAWGHLLRKNLDVSTTIFLSIGGVFGVLMGSFLFILIKEHMKLLELLLGMVFLYPALLMVWEGFRRMPSKEGNFVPGTPLKKFILGSVVGIIAGLLGLAGGFILVPVMLYLFSAPVYITIGTSLASIIPITLIGGSIKLYQGFVDLPSALLLGLGAAIGAQIGAKIIKLFKPHILKLIFGILFLYISIKFIASFFGIII